MSRNLRPIYEVWGEPSSVFVPTDQAIELLRLLADGNGLGFRTETDDETIVVYLDPGKRALALFAGLDAAVVARKFAPLLADAGEDDLQYLLGNLKLLTPSWREFYHRIGREDDYLALRLDYY